MSSIILKQNEMILIFTLGFDEKFALRTIFRRGIKVGDKIIVVMPEKNDPRAEKAYLMLQQIISNSIPGIPIEKITIPSQDFPRAVSLLRKIALSLLRKNGKIVLGLSGGQRIIILQLLAAFLSVGAREVEIEIESEDSSIVATFPLGMMMKVELDQDEIRILKSIAESPKTFSQICSSLNLSKSSAWRKLKRLIELGLIKKAEKGYELTDLGRSKIDVDFNVDWHEL